MVYRRRPLVRRQWTGEDRGSAVLLVGPTTYSYPSEFFISAPLASAPTSGFCARLSSKLAPPTHAYI